jgi:hypothetical protein
MSGNKWLNLYEVQPSKLSIWRAFPIGTRTVMRSKSRLIAGSHFLDVDLSATHVDLLVQQEVQ